MRILITTIAFCALAAPAIAKPSVISPSLIGVMPKQPPIVKVKPKPMPDNSEVWIRIGRCEQPGSGKWGVNWIHPGPQFQGGLGFYSGTWDSYRPSGYPDEAGQATWRQQMNVANRVANDVGFSAWGCF